MDLSASNAEGAAIISFADVGNISANSAIDKVRSQWELFCTVPIFHFQVFEQDSGALHWVHTLISNMKSFLLGTFHGLGKKHLQSYFDEFAFRFNRRFWPEKLFPRLVRAVVASNILGYDDLTR